MREILFRGKRTDNGEWVEGYLTKSYFALPYRAIWCIEKEEVKAIYKQGTEYTMQPYEITPETIGQYTGLKDKNGKKIFERDIVQYSTCGFDCCAIVTLGEYKQDCSESEYSPRDCIGFYVEVDNFTCPDWCDNELECLPECFKQQNILEIVSECEVIGNIHDNPELLKVNNGK